MLTETILQDISLYKENLMYMLLSDSEICEILLGHPCTDDDISDIVYTQIFPYLYVDETQTEVLTYICIEVDIPIVPTGTMKDMRLIVWAYSHKDCIQCTTPGYSGIRPDVLADLIDRKISSHTSCRAFGIGTPTLASAKYFFPQNKYYGRQLIYKIPDFKVKKDVICN